MSTTPIAARIAQLEQYLAARADPAGNPRAGYKANVIAIKAELSRLRSTTPPPAPPKPT